MFQSHLQRIPHRIKKVSCRYLNTFRKKIGTKGFLVCAVFGCRYMIKAITTSSSNFN